MAHHYFNSMFRGIAQLVEQRSPKPRAEGSKPSAPANPSLDRARSDIVSAVLDFFMLLSDTLLSSRFCYKLLKCFAVYGIIYYNALVGSGNMKWSNTELMLVIDLYDTFKHNRDQLFREESIQKLSNLLRSIAIANGKDITADYRSYREVVNKLNSITRIATDGNMLNCKQEDIAAYKHYYLEADKSKLMCSKIYVEYGGIALYDKNKKAGYKKTKNSPIFAEQYNVSLSDYSDVQIECVGFSKRTQNFLCRAGIFTVDRLLLCSDSTLKNMKNAGTKSIAEIHRYISSLKSITEKTSKKNNNFVVSNNPILSKYSEEIKIGDFSFIEKLSSNKDVLLAEKVKVACDVLGEELVSKAIESPESIMPIYSMFNDFYHQSMVQIKISHILEKCINKIPKHRLDYNGKVFINAYTTDESKRNLLTSLFVDKKAPLRSIVYNNSILEKFQLRLMTKFLSWCSYDISKLIDESLFEMNEKLLKVIQMRSQGRTLEEISHYFNCTRERIRQLELKAFRIFKLSQKKKDLIMLISADRNDDDILTREELKRYFGEKSEVLIYLLSSIKSQSYKYDHNLDVFVVGNEEVYGKVIAYIEENVPSMFYENELDKICEKANDKYGFSKELIKTAINDQYDLTGRLYHRQRITKTMMYAELLKKYYPDGIRVYDEFEMTQFRQYFKENYGDVSLSKTTRAIAARISDICVLCNRGMYKLKQESYISKELENEILDYIENSDNVVFMFSTIFYVFKDKLAEFGIVNRYYLQGVLRELFSDKYYFTRDYLYKDSDANSVACEIVKYIKRFNYPIRKKVICNEFPGITEIVISFALSDPNIINLFGMYIHCDNLPIDQADLKYLKKTAEIFTSDKLTHHCKDLFDYINNDKPSLLKRYYVINTFGLFSLLENKFRDNFNFERPYIARNDVAIERVDVRLHEFIYNKDVIKLSEITEFARTYHMHIYSILDYVNEINDTYLLINNDMIATYDHIGINEEIAETVEQLVVDSIGARGCYIKHLLCKNKFPELNVEWTDWLIYSVLNRWGKRTEVSAVKQFATVNNQFRYALPAVKLKDSSFDFKNMQPVDNENQASCISIDDLKNIDDLLSGMPMED